MFEASNVGRLGMTDFAWKGRTFIEISSILQNNQPMDLSQNGTTKLFFKSMPLKHYRREITATPGVKSNFRNSQKILSNMEIPGGTVVASTETDCIENSTTLYFQMENSHTSKPCSSCDDSIRDDTTMNNSRYTKSLSQEDNARKRVRSAGMNRPRFKNNRPESYNSSSQYLHGRNRTFAQNQFNNLRIENPKDSALNVYASNTIQYCDTTGDTTQYVPVFYKPNNAKFAVQGAVESSARLARLKYDTITDAGSKMSQAYGLQTANALSYGVPVNGYTIKDKVGYPNISTPVIKPNGTLLRKC